MSFYELIMSIFALVCLIGFGVFALVWLSRYDLKFKKMQLDSKQKERDFLKSHYDLIEQQLSDINEKFYIIISKDKNN